VRDQKGKFREADGGTLFLDEVGDMSSRPGQGVAALQEGRVEPVAGWHVGVDVRVIAATTRIWRRNHRGRFREDLYFRLAVVPLRVPPCGSVRDILPWRGLHHPHRPPVRRPPGT